MDCSEIRDGDPNNLTRAIKIRILSPSTLTTTVGSTLVGGREEEHGVRIVAGAREAAGAETIHP